MGAERAAAPRRAARSPAYPVALCLTGAGLALLAVTRVWSVQVTARPGLSDLRDATTGAGRAPWLTALALVGIAGVGALLATRGLLRRVVGVLLVAVGVGLMAGAAATRAGLDAGAAGPGGTLWPVVAVLGGLVLAAGGGWTVRDGHRWPAMGARYDRAGAVGPPGGRTNADGITAARTTAEQAAAGPGGAGQRRGADPVDTRAAWDALDRGDDPTLG